MTRRRGRVSGLRNVRPILKGIRLGHQHLEKGEAVRPAFSFSTREPEAGFLIFPQALLDSLKGRVKASLGLLGLEIRRVEHAPPPPLCDDPLEVLHRRNSHDLVALDCPLSDCVAFNGMSLSKQGWHPLVRAASEYVESGNREYEGSCLEQYYATWQPRNGREALLCAVGPAILERYPSYVKHAPWLHRTVDEQAAYMARVIEIENLAFGDGSLGSSAGYGLHGPISKEKGQLEYDRLVNLVDSIRKKGYSRSAGDVTVHVLQRADRFRYVILHGHHRAAVLAALGHDSIPAIPEVLVDSRYADHWPAVYRQEWSKEEALAYFSHLFDFDSLAWARDRQLTP